MKEVFDQMEAEVDQNDVDKKCAEIERKNLLIENDNLIVECLSKDVFYTATNFMLTVSKFSDMHDAYSVAQKHIITRAKTIDKTTSLLTEIENLKAQIKGKMKCVTMPAEKPKVLAPSLYAINGEPIPSRNRNNKEVHLDYLTHLKESVGTLCEIVEESRVRFMVVECPSTDVQLSRCLTGEEIEFGKRGGEGDRVNWTSSGVIGERVRVMSMDAFSLVGGGGGTLRGGDSIEDEEVSLVDGVLEGALGALGFGNGSSSGCHGGLWRLIMDEEDDELVICI
ncbi:hypothetical protein Tco_0892102 [Tanacetum coccineum]|uniref:Uncharacterized protein n=1 Tax=Tanacetum coccineum TaxID=301880 RepID=A0ABQ5C4W6_9ASTR